MKKKSNLFVTLAILFSMALVIACRFSAGGTGSGQVDLIGTSAAQTLTAFPPFQPQGHSPTSGAPLPVVTVSPQQTTEIPTASNEVFVQVSVDTHCRKGPGQAYDSIGALRVGERAVVVGKYPPADYWIIENPDGGGLCWLWGQYASIEGDASRLPLMTPFPLPTQSPATPSTFTLMVQFYDIELCGQEWVLAFEVASPDVGAQGFQSAEVGVMDVTAGNIKLGSRTSNAPFCLHPCGPCDDSSGPGAWTLLSVPIGSSPHHGDQAAAKIIVCTQDNLAGICAVQDFSFTIP